MNKFFHHSNKWIYYYNVYAIFSDNRPIACGMSYPVENDWYNSEMTDKIPVMEQAPVNTATNDHINATSMTCFSDNADNAPIVICYEHNGNTCKLYIWLQVTWQCQYQNLWHSNHKSDHPAYSILWCWCIYGFEHQWWRGWWNNLFCSRNGCRGLQHYRVIHFLCSSKYKHAAMQGTAILYWQFDDHHANAWFSFDCKKIWSAGDDCDNTCGMCWACWSVNKYI